MALVARVVASGLVLCSCITAAAQRHESLLVLSKRDHTLAVVDPRTLQVVAKVPVGEDPHEVTASADGTRAYVSNYGFGAYHTLAVVDLTRDQALPSIDLGALRGPHGLCEQGGKTWFTAEAAKALGRLDPTTGKVDLILGTGQNRTHMIWVSADGQEIVTTNVNSGTVSLFTQEPVPMPGPPPGASGSARPRPPAAPPGAPPMPRTDWTEAVIRVGNGSEGFDVSPDGHEIWVANAQDGTISVLSLPGKKVLQTLRVDVVGANRLKITPDGRTALISSGPDLVIIDVPSRQVKTRIAVGHGSGGVLVAPDGLRAFVACGPDNQVAVVDLQQLRVIGHVQPGGEPDGMAWASRR